MADELTRSSDFKNRKALSKRTSFGRKPKAAAPGEITRSSDTKRPQRSFVKTKPNHSSKSYAVWMLGRREYSESDLRQKLIRRGYTPEEAEEAITFVKCNGYQSDERYAGMKARSISRRAGDVKVVLTLKAKGISDDLAKSQIIELDSDADRAFALAKGRFEKILTGGSLSTEAKQKVYRFLAGRGFSVASIKDALARLTTPM